LFQNNSRKDNCFQQSGEKNETHFDNIWFRTYKESIDSRNPISHRVGNTRESENVSEAIVLQPDIMDSTNTGAPSNPDKDVHSSWGLPGSPWPSGKYKIFSLPSHKTKRESIRL